MSAIVSFVIVHSTTIYPQSVILTQNIDVIVIGNLDTRTPCAPSMSVDPGSQEIVIIEDVDNVLHSGALRERLQDPSLGEGTITLIIRDPNITIIGDMNLFWNDREGAPLHGCKSLLRVDLKGCTKLTQLGRLVFMGCSSLTSVSLPDGVTQLGNGVFNRCSSLTSVALPDGLTQLGEGVFMDCSSLTSVAANKLK